MQVQETIDCFLRKMDVLVLEDTFIERYIHRPAAIASGARSRGMMRRQRSVSSIWTLRSRVGRQPSSRCALAMSPTRRGESPGRRGPT